MSDLGGACREATSILGENVSSGTQHISMLANFAEWGPEEMACSSKTVILDVVKRPWDTRLSLACSPGSLNCRWIGVEKDLPSLQCHKQLEHKYSLVKLLASVR